MSVTREGARVPGEAQEGSSVAKLLEKHFDTAFAAPDGIRKLRELILTLAMQGKLVPQDPNDQPAGELLKEIAAEKKRLVKEGKIKVPKPFPEIRTEEVPYALPVGWEWVRLGDIGLIGSSSRVHQKDWRASGVPFYRAREIVKLSRNGFVDNDLFITEELFKSLTASGLVPTSGDIMITGVGTIGIPYVVKENDRFYFKDASVLIFKNYFKISPFYLLHLFRSQLWNNSIHAESMGTTVHTLTIVRANETLIPLPPLAEQRRIIAKIDQLMARCDELEKLCAERKQKRLTVHTAALSRLLEPSSPSLSSSFPRRRESSDSMPEKTGSPTESFGDDKQFSKASDAWRFITQHFGELYSVKENVAELRKATLQLAVMGKLVPQDPHDQPAGELLKEIEREKKLLVKGGKIKAPKPLLEIKPEEVPYKLPESWEWVRLGNVSTSSDSGWSPQCLSESRSNTEWGVLKVSAVSWGEFKPDENKALPPGMEARPECEVKEGDFLISRANTQELVARSVVVKATPPYLMMSDKIVRFNFPDKVDIYFINNANSVNFSREYYASNASGTSSSMKNVSREVMSNLPIPLPPLAEQHRIVAKIDQLMALCDAMEQQIDAATGKRTALLNAVMAQV